MDTLYLMCQITPAVPRTRICCIEGDPQGPSSRTPGSALDLQNHITCVTALSKHFLSLKEVSACQTVCAHKSNQLGVSQQPLQPKSLLTWRFLRMLGVSDPSLFLSLHIQKIPLCPTPVWEQGGFPPLDTLACHRQKLPCPSPHSLSSWLLNHLCQVAQSQLNYHQSHSTV